MNKLKTAEITPWQYLPIQLFGVLTAKLEFMLPVQKISDIDIQCVWTSWLVLTGGV
jgi:hypothetical protein